MPSIRFFHATALPRVALMLTGALLAGSPWPGHAAAPPTHFSASATTDLGGGMECVVGSNTDADGMNARAWVMVRSVSTQKVRWATPVPLTKGWYQNQATHCVANGQTVDALVQSDTASVASDNQTFLHVAAFDAGTGKLESVIPVKAPGAHGRVSLSVGKEPSNFRLQGKEVVVSGTWSVLPDRATETPFTASPSTKVARP